jgi:hypothetical protein
MNDDERIIDSHCCIVRDLNTGTPVYIYHPEHFRLETLLINSGYYSYWGQEYRFLLCEARKAGLNYQTPEKRETA